VLVYSTCTISTAENERLIADFLDSHADFGLDDLTVEFSGARLGSGSSGFLVTMPHRDRTAGFFIARLRRS
jgi:16S rRNA (cytosine967-C5)-methyltransferase